MKKSIYILIFLLILSSCSNLNEKKPLSELFSEDFKSFEIDDKIGIIDLDSVSNFAELRQKMGKLTCEGKSSGLRFKSNDTIYHLTGFADCPTSGEIGCYFRRNLLFVRNDSLVIKYGKNKKTEPIEFLKTELNKIISKKYNFQYNENKLKPALIYFYVEDKYPIETTKRALKEIVRQFKEINSQNGSDYFKYNILFEGFDITNIPPPPPPKQNEFDNE
ncbi:lipoprotein [Cellulophaga lytica]|uniref:lipoprotein n=1 Tax=Cellulophaga lytica TaxID=979 RepID=UPI0012FC0E66|nr:lipoprotein [Cellulophaga lytica]